MGVRWGLLSTAAINQAILTGARASDRVEITAVASRTQERADAYAAEHGIPVAHGSYQSLLDDADVDAVYISNPNSQHVEWTVKALDAGKHVLVEKPFSRRAAEVADACRLAADRGLVLSEAFMWRHSPQTAKLVELVRDGAVGRVVAIRAAFNFHLESARGLDDTRAIPELDGGGLMDVGCYCVSGIRLLAGAEPERVSAEQLVGPTGVDMAMVGSMRMANGVLAHFDCGFASPIRHALEVVGESGSLLVRDPWHARVPGVERWVDGKVEPVAVPAADSYRLQMENLTDTIAGCARLTVGPDDAIGQARAIEALYASAESGTVVTL